MFALNRLCRSRTPQRLPRHSSPISFAVDKSSAPSISTTKVADAYFSRNHDEYDNPNQKKARLSLAPLLSRFGSSKTLLCCSLTFWLVFMTLLHRGTQRVLRQTFADHHHSIPSTSIASNEDSCPIAAWTYPRCASYLRNKDHNSNSSLPPALSRPALTPQQWYDLRRKFVQAVGSDASSLDPSWPSSQQQDGFLIPVQVRQSPGKGRGVFTATHVAAGQMMWDNRYSARFPTECSVRQFFSLITEEEACNIIMWGYVNDFFGRGLQFQVDLDAGVYMNEGKTKDEINTVIRFLRPQDSVVSTTSSSSTTTTYTSESMDEMQRVLDPEQYYAHRRVPRQAGVFALRDLEPGTEILIDYEEVHIVGKLWWYEKLCFHSRGLWGWLTQI